MLPYRFERVADIAHEFGHFLGNSDEYIRNLVTGFTRPDPDIPQSGVSLMGTTSSSGRVLQRHIEPLLDGRAEINNPTPVLPVPDSNAPVPGSSGQSQGPGNNGSSGLGK